MSESKFPHEQNREIGTLPLPTMSAPNALGTQGPLLSIAACRHCGALFMGSTGDGIWVRPAGHCTARELAT